VFDPDPETFTTLQQAAGRLRRLVDDVAMVSRAEEGQLDLERRVVEPRQLVESAVAAMQETYARAGVGLGAHVAPGLPNLDVDPERIHQVLANLLDNARHHTPAGGRVKIRVVKGDSDVVITVEDTGEGIPVDQLARVFERFYRGDAARTSGTGTGIGLTIARGIARSHGGTLVADSAGPGRGSVFALRLPATS
jgi:signal transduction histidine kinase